jgi:isoprenylcysteine carboxyl methyltransferase (ICMT) family protein YpbQ
MINTIALWVGFVVMVLLALLVIVILFYANYILYDYWLKKILGWKEREVRKDLFYFFKHKEKIRNIIKREK